MKHLSPLEIIVVLLLSIPGIGVSYCSNYLMLNRPSTVLLKSQISSFFFGIKPSVSESGKFKSDRNKIFKRGTRFGRRALYAVALASVRNSRSGNPINNVLCQYRKENLNGKKNKVALGAIMHKIIKYIFAVLRDQKPYELRDPQIHIQMYLNNNNRTVS